MNGVACSARAALAIAWGNCGGLWRNLMSQDLISLHEIADSLASHFNRIYSHRFGKAKVVEFRGGGVGVSLPSGYVFRLKDHEEPTPWGTNTHELSLNETVEKPKQAPHRIAA